MPYVPKILIVDDEPRVCDSLKVLLGNEGYEIYTGHSGQQALEWLAKNGFDLVLLDLVMPGVNGREIMDHINSQHLEAFVIVITGHATVDSAIESLRKGAYDYIRKPFEYEELSRAVRNAIDQKRLKSERKQEEQELRNLIEEVENFVHVVSHDLKNPIISIQGFSSRLLKKYQEKLGEEGRNYLDYIMASARRMDLLVSDLLALSGIGRVVSAFKDVSSLEIVKNVISDLQHRLKDSGIELVVADNLPTIYCDGARISQVFENLLINATKFMGGTKNPRIEIGCEHRGDFHQFYVRDNGIGIDPKYHLKIFEAFHRLKQIEDEEGTGLGLAIVKRIVNNHGGSVWVDSKKGKGATLYFTLPKLSNMLCV